MNEQAKAFYDKKYGGPINSNMTVGELDYKMRFANEKPGIDVNKNNMHTICAPYFLEALNKLWDMQIQTVSCGRYKEGSQPVHENIDDLGITCKYNTLSDEHKKYIDSLIEKGLLIEDFPYRKSTRYVDNAKEEQRLLDNVYTPERIRYKWSEEHKQEYLAHEFKRIKGDDPELENFGDATKKMNEKCFRISIPYDENAKSGDVAKQFVEKLEMLKCIAKERPKIKAIPKFTFGEPIKGV